jgi:hypothetical protein
LGGDGADIAVGADEHGPAILDVIGAMDVAIGVEPG